MPQLGPSPWLNLFLMFILGYALFSILNYISKPPVKIEILAPKPIISEKSWKW